MSEEKQDADPELAEALRSLGEAAKVKMDREAEKEKDREDRRAAIRKVLAARRRELEEKQSIAQRQEDLNSAIAWLTDKWGERPCPYCGEGPWEVGTPAQLMTTGQEEHLTDVFPVMCQNCGHTTFVNAIRSGLRPEPTDEAPDE